MEPTPHDRELVDAAEQVIAAHGDGALHTVAAAVRDEHGDVHVGVNLYHFTGGPCAELVALATARAAGALAPQTIVAVGDAGRGVLSPCGRDRQVFADHHPHLRVIVPRSTGAEVVRAADLLPRSFSWPAEQVQRLRFRATHLDAVRAGRKRLTLRFHDPVQVGRALLVFESPVNVSLPGRITSTVAKRVSEVTEEEAHADGFQSRADVLPLLRGYYPDLQADDTIVLVAFELDD
ncbi:ASCH domain-containing protein [Modestobacter sp. SYSU DS0875]